MLIDQNEEIITKRCRMRFPSETDIPHVWSATRYAGFNDGMLWDPPVDIDELHEPLQRNRQNWDEGTAFTWTIESKESCEFIGRVSIRREDGTDEWSIGFWIHPLMQGNGYATEVAQAVVEFGFSRLDTSLITAAHATWNEASGKVLERVGMTRVRKNPRGFKKRGKWVEEFEYEIRP